MLWFGGNLGSFDSFLRISVRVQLGRNSEILLLLTVFCFNPGFEVFDVCGPLECLDTLTNHPPDSKLTLSVIGRPVDDDPPDVPIIKSPVEAYGIGPRCWHSSLTAVS